MLVAADAAGAAVAAAHASGSANGILPAAQSSCPIVGNFREYVDRT